MRIEYLYLPAVRTQYASEFGHLIRILTIFAKMEYVLDELNGLFLGFQYTVPHYRQIQSSLQAQLQR